MKTAFTELFHLNYSVVHLISKNFYYLVPSMDSQGTQHIPNMKEKTLRYPGHIRLIQALKASGFFSEKEISIGGKRIKPIDVTNKILIKEWELKSAEDEFTIMKIIIDGIRDNKKHRVSYELFDQYDHATNLSSMARTTGYTATAAVNMIIEGKFNHKGVFPPENVGKEEVCFNYILDYLKQRNIHYNLEDK
jgi:saccharopine dehydrogenase-like NADP-dependent oxidoreductase